MFDIGMSELLLIGIVALIVVGPKDLPALFHTLGKFTAKMRSLGREFTNAMNDAARESGVDDVAKGLKNVANPKKFGLDKLGEAADRFDKWEPGKTDASSKAPPKAPADEKRAADVEKIRAATEKAGQDRLDREAAAKAAGKAAGKAADTKGGSARGSENGPQRGSDHAADTGTVKGDAAAAKAKPAKAARQTKPAKPAKQTKPAKPAKAAKTAKPAKPARQTKPAKPARQTKPAKPAAPAASKAKDT